MFPSEHIRSQLDTLPDRTGCYLMKNEEGKVIYIGKAISLRSRVRSYFHASAQHHPRTEHMVQRVRDIEWIVVDSELEALILEMTLIKKHKPHYNVRLKDDKRYPYIKVHWADPFPKVTVTRNMVTDGSRYFGPYTSVWAVHKTLDVLRKIFPYLTCDRVITGEDTRACLYYDIKLCTAPCIGKIDQANYRQMISDLCEFLNGRTEPIVNRLTAEMSLASSKLQYEKAAAVRDQLQAIESIVERQKVISSDYVDSDVIAMARSEREACVQVFFIRGGKLIGREFFMMENTADSPDVDVMAEFIKQYYEQAASVPPEVLLPQEVEEAQVIRQWLSQRRGDGGVEIKIPRSGPKHELIQMAAENAAETLAALQSQWQADAHRQTEALSELQEALGLPRAPERIECYDISNTQGTAAVGSMVVFERGVPNTKLYRRFNIKTVEGPDDFASMQEVLTRRFKRWAVAEQPEDKPGKKPDAAFANLPDLLIVDGGRGQLARAVAVLEEFNLLERVPLISLAKQNEEVFRPGHAQGLLLPRNSPGLFLLQRVRDEAHRFAITAHRNRRSKNSLVSQLDGIPGVGPNRRRALLKAFGSVEALREAEIEQLTAIRGITPALAAEIKGHLE
ncbi:MAG TPA: excinuclease ABC subunit UvrC [Anaerolineales bacterium]|nr:excinuclease ABC subunit UvrC [Anaerolineales bacterium]HRQ91717.1 excinuclease ABC subunit UvrC [Anaerolineales bacterium]